MAGGAVARSASTKLEALQSQLRHTEELMSTMSPPSKSSTEVADRGDSSKSPGGRDPREARRLQWLKAADAGASSFFEHLYQQEKAEPLFAELGGLMDCSDEEGNTALHRAATLGHAKSVEWLVRQGANLQAKNHSGETPIDVATPDVLRALGQTAGADEGVPPASAVQQDQRVKTVTSPQVEMREAPKNSFDTESVLATASKRQDSICERSFFLFSEAGWTRQACTQIVNARGPLFICCPCCCPRTQRADSGPSNLPRFRTGALAGSADDEVNVRQAAHADAFPRTDAGPQVNYFESTVLIAIILNSIVLASYDPVNLDSDGNALGETFGKIFTVIFTIEMLIKMIDQGVCLFEGSYLRSGLWNWLDFVVVCTGWLDFIPGFDNRAGILRTIRLLRPLRAIGVVKGLRQQVQTLSNRETLVNIGNVLLMMLITFAVFSVVAVRFFAGALRGNCFSGATLLPLEDTICNDEATDSCGEGFCSEKDPVTGILNDNPAFDIINFDSFGSAMIIVFVCTTLEGWTDVMYMVQDGYSDWAALFFVALIIFASLVIVNLFLAVISGSYEDSVAEEFEEKRFSESAVQCAEILAHSLHDAIIRPGVEQTIGKLESGWAWCRVGQKVQLNHAAKQLLKRRSANAILNMGLDTQGTIVTVRPNGRVRIKTEESEDVECFGWHDIVSIEPAGAKSRSKKMWEAMLQAWTPAVEARTKTLANNFAGDSDAGSSGANVPLVDIIVDQENFVAGLTRLRESQDILRAKLARCNAPQDEKRLEAYLSDWTKSSQFKDELLLTSPSACALLQCLTTPQKGRDKHWQELMLKKLFDTMGTPLENENVDRHTFYQAIVHPICKPGEESDQEVVEQQEAVDVSIAAMQGRSSWEVLTIYSRFLSTHSTFNNIVTGIVIFNCCLLALEYYNMDECGSVWSMCVLDALNTVCTFVFLVEMAIKLVGLTPRGYIKDRFNIFDGAIVVSSFIEMAMPGDGGGIAMLRSLRILRVLKAATQFPNLRMVLATILSVLPNLANFFALLFLFVFFYAVLGMHLFGGTYDSLNEVFGEHPRTNFDSFWWSIMTVFQVLTGEDWNAAMYDAIETNGWGAAVYFISLFIFGGYIMLNLFLAVLLVGAMDAFEQPVDMQKELMIRAGTYNEPAVEPQPTEVGEFAVIEGKTCCVLRSTNSIRLGMQTIIQDSRFDNFILACILISSCTLALEKPPQRVHEQDDSVAEVLDSLDLIFIIVFSFEMIIKISTVGLFFSKGTYLRNPWNVLDGTVVFAAILSRALADEGMSWIKALRVLRALRPLRVIKRVPELKQVVQSLFRAIPIMSNVLVVLGMFWLVAGILGVRLFQGLFYSCNDLDTEYELMCSGAFVSEDGSISFRDWIEPEWGFDNVGQAMLTLFEVSTLERWLDIMYLCIDGTEPGRAPYKNSSPAMGLFFIIFIMTGSFFMLELFVSAIVTAYALINSDGTAFQSERQKRLIANMVTKEHEDDYAPASEWQEPLYALISNPRFDLLVIVCVVLNTVVLMLHFDRMSSVYSDTLDVVNAIFTCIFLVEAAVKILACTPHRYFHGPGCGWNRFDFTLVVITSTELLVTILASGSDISWMVVLRVFRIARIFRLFAKFKGLTNIFLAIVQALPTIINVGAVLFLLFFIYAVLGVNLFGGVKHGEFINDRANFESFGVSLLTIFRMVTGESWNGVMSDCRIEPPDCDPDIADDCGKPYVALIYFVSFQILGQYVMLNLFVAVMLEFYQRQQEAVEQHLTFEDQEIFRRTWTSFVGRDRRPPYRAYKLMPVALFDVFMHALPPNLGWTEEERRCEKARRDGYNEIELPTRAMKMLVPWNPQTAGHDSMGGHTRSGFADVEFEEKRLTRKTATKGDKKVTPGSLGPAADTSSSPTGASKTVSTTAQNLKSKANLSSFKESCTLHVRGCGGKYASEAALRQVFSKFGTFVHATVRLRIDKETGRDTSWALVRMADKESYSKALAATIHPDDQTTFEVNPYSGNKAAKSTGAMANTLAKQKMFAFERARRLASGTLTQAEREGYIAEEEEFCRAENLTPSQRELLMVQGLWSRVATMENHYFHYDEVWHALYSRAEQRHLVDPENPDFKDDDSQKRQVKLFQSIMRTTSKEVRRKIAATVHLDTSVPIVTEPFPLTPRHTYSAMMLQKKFKSQKNVSLIAAVADLKKKSAVR